MNCLFCKIVSGEIPSYKIYQDDIVIVIMDINPKTNGHLLIIPKTRYVDIYELPDNVLLHINEIAKKMYDLLKNKLQIDGASFVNNVGSAQEVKHYHMHVIPNKNDKEIKNVEDIYKKLTN